MQDKVLTQFVIYIKKQQKNSLISERVSWMMQGSNLRPAD